MARTAVRRGRWAVLAVAGALAIGGCSSSASKGAASSGEKEPAMSIDTGKQYTMTIHTDQGDIVIAMDPAKTPHTVNSMNYLAGRHFYDGSFCHRLSTTPNLQMLQCGDPKAGAVPKDSDGSGGPGYTFQDENLSGATYPDGTVAMANGGPNDNGSQFFLVFGDSHLPPSYTPFGTITAGHEILIHVASGGIAKAGADGTGRPNIPVQIKSVTVSPG